MLATKEFDSKKTLEPGDLSAHSALRDTEFDSRL
jgi:hypothetical protein